MKNHKTELFYWIFARWFAFELWRLYMQERENARYCYYAIYRK